MNQPKLVGKIYKLCELRLYDVAIKLTNQLEIAEYAVKAHLLCMEHEQRARLDKKILDYRGKNMYQSDFTLDIEGRKKIWFERNQCLPNEIYVMEFYGSGDPYFGGTADDRLLTVNGDIWNGKYPKPDAKVFSSIEEAAQAAALITNRRENSVLGLIPYFE